MADPLDLEIRAYRDGQERTIRDYADQPTHRVTVSVTPEILSNTDWIEWRHPAHYWPIHPPLDACLRFFSCLI